MASSACSRRALEGIDWDFANVENRGIHLIHWYPATFVSAIPGSLIPMLTNEGDFVVDPFCGSGATLVEAVRLGRTTHGFDTNPVATLISRAKLAPPQASEIAVLRDEIRDLAGALPLALAEVDRLSHPNRPELLRWYHLDTFLQLRTIQSKVESLPAGRLRTAAQCVFSSTLKATSSQGRHYGWVCDNVTPKADEIQAKNAISSFVEALTAYELAVAELRDDMVRRGIDPSSVERGKTWNVERIDACQGLRSLAPRVVDAIVTSPPYFGMADYVKSQRLTFLWNHPDVAEIEGWGDLEDLREAEIGSRSHRRRTRSPQEYRDYMERFVQVASGALKKDGVLCVVMGASTASRPTGFDMDDAASRCGLERIFSSERDIRVTKRRLRAQLEGESVVVYKK
ncbi:MAG: site-specific DNA-methyltransferase [Proteobacteria bacterium]|nr:site-specific DNA-methyltransferase [Pseudomonadota bacterium]